MKKLNSKSEDELKLIERAKAGDDRAFDRLAQRYRKSVYYLIFRMVRNAEDAEDLTQDTFVKSYGSITKFDPRFAFSTWLFRIATNNCIDFLRKRRMQMLSINETLNQDEGGGLYLQLVDPELIPYEELQKQQRHRYLMLAIEQLPERYQKLVHLRYFMELSYDEIAEQLALPLGTVKAQLHRSRELLNQTLAEVMKSLY